MMRLSLVVFISFFSATSWASLEQCQQLKSKATQLNCMEELLKAYEAYFEHQGLALLEPEQALASVAELKKEKAQADFGREKQKLAEQNEHLSALESKVTEVKKNPYGKLTLTLDNKQIWKLTDKGIKVKTGDVIVIERGALGSFYVKKAGSSRKARAKRVK